MALPIGFHGELQFAFMFSFRCFWDHSEFIAHSYDLKLICLCLVQGEKQFKRSKQKPIHTGPYRNIIHYLLMYTITLVSRYDAPSFLNLYSNSPCTQWNPNTSCGEDYSPLAGLVSSMPTGTFRSGSAAVMKLVLPDLVEMQHIRLLNPAVSNQPNSSPSGHQNGPFSPYR